LSWGKGEELKKALRIKALNYIRAIPEREAYLLRYLDAPNKDKLNILVEMKALYPEDKEILYQLAQTYRLNYDNDSALVYYQRVLKIDPSFQPAFLNLWRTYWRMGDNEKIKEFAQKHMSIDPTNVTQFMASYYYRTEQYEQAIIYLKRLQNFFIAGYGYRGIYFPRSIFLLGKCYQYKRRNHFCY
jgi:tetratricopeptide (TPR) repeat protein